MKIFNSIPVALLSIGLISCDGEGGAGGTNATTTAHGLVAGTTMTNTSQLTLKPYCLERNEAQAGKVRTGG